MRTNKKWMFLLPLLLLVFIRPAQGQLALADELFDNFEFMRAAEYYSSVSAETPLDDDHLMKHAYCYYATYDYQKALPLYEKIIGLNKVRNIHYLYYADVLKNTGNYDLSAEMYRKYISLEPQDYRGVVGEQSAIWLKDHKGQASSFELKNAELLNSGAADLCALAYGDGYLYISEKPSGGSSLLDLVNKGKYSEVQGSLQYGADFIPRARYYYSRSVSDRPEMFLLAQDTAYEYGPPCFDYQGRRVYLAARKIVDDPSKQELEPIKIWTGDYDAATKRATNFTEFAWGASYMNFLLGMPNLALSPDGNLLVFPSLKEGGFGGSDLYACTKDPAGAWSQPVNLGSSVNSAGNEIFPQFSGDGKLIFSSDGYAGYGGLDIFSVKMNGTTATSLQIFPEPFNSFADDFWPVWQKDGFSGLLSSDRPGGRGDDDLWAYSLKPLPMKGHLADRINSKPIQGAKIILRDAQGNETVAQSDANGDFTFSDVVANAPYTLNASADGYLSQNFQASTEIAFNSEMLLAAEGEIQLPETSISLEPKQVVKEILLADIFYDFDSWKLRDASVKALDELADILASNPDIIVLINSHTDERGPDFYNRVLSERRAQSVINYLSDSKADMSRLAFKGWGESMPVKKHARSREEHQANRRTTFTVVTDGKIPEGYSTAKFRKLP